MKSQPSKAVDVEFMLIMTSKKINLTVTEPYTVASADGKLNVTVYLDKTIGESGSASGILVFTDDEGTLLQATVADVTLDGNVAKFVADDVANAEGVRLAIWKDAVSSIRPLSAMYTVR